MRLGIKYRTDRPITRFHYLMLTITPPLLVMLGILFQAVIGYMFLLAWHAWNPTPPAHS